MSRLAKFLAVMIIGWAAHLSSQVVVFSGQVNYQGNSVPYAPVQVCAVTSTGTPCTPTASIYYDYNLGNRAPNPASADANGNYTYYAASLPVPAFYVVQITPIPGTTWSYVVAGAVGPSGGQYVSTVVTTPQTILSALNTLPAVGTAGYVCADGYSGVTSNNTFQCIQSSSQGGVAGYAHYGSAQIDQYALNGGTYSYNACPGWDASFPYTSGQCVSYQGYNWTAVTAVIGTPPAATAWTQLTTTGSKSTYAGLVVAETSLTDTINFGIDVPMQNYGTGETIGLNIPMYLPAGYCCNGAEQNEAIRPDAEQVSPNSPIESLITGTVASGALATVTGAAGTNCIVTGFPNGSATEAYVGLSATNTISANTPLTFLNYGGSCTASVCATGSPVTLNLSNGYSGTLVTTLGQGGAATCSGTITANLTASKGGVYTGTLGTVSGTTVPVTGTYNPNTLGASRFIRDFSNELDCNYSWTTAVNSGTYPAFVTQQIAVTGTGCASTLPWNATNPHTQWNCPAIGGLSAGNPACTGQITQTNAVACFDGGASGGLDACVPVTNFSGGLLTVNLFDDFTSASTPWPTNWALTGIVRIYGAAYPTAVTTAGPGQPVTAFTSADVSGLGTGHTVDQVQAYNTAEQDIHSVANMPMGIAGHGDGAFLSNFSPVNSPAKNAAVRTGGYYNYGVYIDGYSQNALQKTQLASVAWGQHAASGIMNEDLTLAAQWTSQQCFYYIKTFSDAMSHCPITIDPLNKFIGFWDNKFSVSMNGNVSASGWSISEFFGTGPYAGNLIHYSEFQGATCTTNWMLAGQTTGASCTNGQSGDIFNGSNAALFAAGGLTPLSPAPNAQYTALDGASITASSAITATNQLPYYFGVNASLLPGQISQATFSVTSGGTFSGPGTVIINALNNGCPSSASITATVVGTNWAGATYLVTNAGYASNGCSSAPTSGTCSAGSIACSGTVVISTSILTQTTVALALHSGSTDPCSALVGTWGSGGFQITTGALQPIAGYCFPTASESLTPIIANFGAGVGILISQASVCQNQISCNPQLITTSAAINPSFGCISLGVFCPSVSTGTAYDVATFNSSGAIVGTPPSNLDATSTILTNTPVQRTANFCGDSQTYSQGGNCTAGTTGTCWMPGLVSAKGYIFGKNIAVSGNTWSDQLKTMFQNNSNSPYTGGPMLYQPNTSVYCGLGQNDANRFSSFYIGFPSNPSDGDTIVINTSSFTFKNTVSNPLTQIQIGGTNAITSTNTLAFACPGGVSYNGSTAYCGGLGSISAVSGGTGSTTGTLTLSSVGTGVGCSGTSAVITISGGSYAATTSITPGSGCTQGTTSFSATCVASGGATCSGTVTVTGVVGNADTNVVNSVFTADVGTSGGANIIRMQPVLSCTSPPCTTYSQALSQTGTSVLSLTTTLPTAAQIQSSVLNQAEFAAVAQTAIPAASANGGLASFLSAQNMTNSGCTQVNATWGYTSNYYAMNCGVGNTLTFTMTGSAFYVGYQGGTVSSGTFNVSVQAGAASPFPLGNTTTNCIYGYSSAQITGCLARVATPGSNGSAKVTLSVSAGSVNFIFGASNGNAVGTLDQSDFRLWEVFDATNNLDAVYDAERQGERQAMYQLGKLDGMPVQDIPEGQAFNCQLNFALCGGAGQHQALTAVPAFIAPMLGETSGVVYQPAQAAQGTGDQLPAGTITGVTASTGLTGGGTAGTVSLAVTNPYTPPTVTYTSPQLSCAHAADTTIASNAVTAIPSGTTITGTSLPAAFTQPGVQFNVTTPSCSAGSMNAGPFTVQSVSSNTITATASLGNCTWSSGGNIYLYCANQSNDALAATPVKFTNNTINQTAAAGTTFADVGQLAYWTPATSPSSILEFFYAGSALSNYSSLTPAASSAGRELSVPWNVTGLSTTQVLVTPAMPMSNTQTASAGPTTVSSGSQVVDMGAYWTASGVSSTLGTITYSSGSSTCTNGTQVATATNGGGSGALGTITVAGNVPTGTITITNPGYGYTSIPTTWTVATCTGTGTYTTSGTLGGAQGAAILMQAFKQTP